MNKGILRDGEAISGAVLAALGVYIVMQARAWDYYTPDGPGPGFFPIWYGIAMTALSLALMVSRVRKADASGAIKWRSAWRALSTWAAFALSVALMGWLGFLLSFALLTLFLVTVVFGRSVLAAGATAVLAGLGFYLVFPLLLNLPLPTGVFGF
jgi:putative tricarboxylic transport membrane protein